LPYKISIIGSGNVAWHLAHTLDAARHTILQVYSRNTEKAQALANPLNAQVVNNISQLSDDIDVLLLCISDDAIETIAPDLIHHRCLIAHTSGAMNMELLKNTSPFYGVFYPLQTLSAGKKVNFYEVPVCVEGNNGASEKILFALGNTISNKVQYINSQERKYLHLAAVFANNFTNALYAKAAEILEQQKLNFDLLRPLILETAQKIQKLPPSEAQTGPAKRHDENTINKHLDLLPEGSDKAKIYRLLTDTLKKKF
jgi:predicted short-subunit dehydrogenase-like oxidoreductase (DUF2520 family)